MPHIHTFNHPILATVCEPVGEGEDLSFLRDMRELCERHNGVGLAAPQIGIAKRAAFIWPKQRGGEAIFMINPVIVERSGMTNVETEGCLSYPGIRCPIERHNVVQVTFRDEQWTEHRRQFTWFAGRVVQHEIDHLDGICRVGDVWKRQQQLRELRNAPQMDSTATGELAAPTPANG